MSTRLYAFWRYSAQDCPPVLGSEVEKVYEDGKVSVKGFPGMKFQPILLLPVKAGKKLMAQIEAVEIETCQELRAVREKALGEYEALLPCLRTL